MTVTSSAEAIFQANLGSEVEDVEKNNPKLHKAMKMAYFSGMLTIFAVAADLRSNHSADVAEAKLRKLKAEIVAYLRSANESTNATEEGT